MPDRLATQGGSPVRPTMLPYGRQLVEEDDIEAVVAVLRSSMLTTGELVDEFERRLAEYVGAKYAVVLSNGTAALHASAAASGLAPGDEAVVTPMTFVASANCVAYCAGVPVFADVDPDSLLIDPAGIEQKITPRTRAVIAVDYAGQPCDYQAITEVCHKYGLTLIEDACHALGAEYQGKRVGSFADMTVFSFHPVKHITTAEGGAVATDDQDLADKIRRFRNHGISTDHRQRAANGSWGYEISVLGYNYRLTDIQCALGISQLQKADRWLARRRAIAGHYDKAFEEIDGIGPLKVAADVRHAYHLYVVQIDPVKIGMDRTKLFQSLRAENIGINVHYIPVHLHQYYRDRFGTTPGLCPVAESAYENLISLPMFPAMTDDDAADVISAIKKVIWG